MNRVEEKAGHRLNHMHNTEDASSKKDTGKLIEVKKKDTARDKNNNFIVHEKPSDEQMYESFDDLRKDHIDKKAD
jgi:rubrerythrin